MVAFRTGVRCEMCNGGWVERNYCLGGRSCPDELEVGEHMHRECRLCGYRWVESLERKENQPNE